MKAIKALVIALMGLLGSTLAKQLPSFQGGQDQGAPCEAFSHHGLSVREADVADVLPQTVAWIAQPR
ncbi:hypothetical protein DZC30_21465 [Comamonas testosteroni]|uniref:Uncharacterized protein n=1 Tax=Comamonas testosteroni TaxID=285 RepID=A0A373F6V0_COMTE|nr:hypothetical protein [Comamonas testosteroni]RGE39730.1 hypothetical protein DZC30_21465 [Comamonas testosteroni]